MISWYTAVSKWHPLYKVAENQQFGGGTDMRLMFSINIYLHHETYMSFFIFARVLNQLDQQ